MRSVVTGVIVRWSKEAAKERPWFTAPPAVLAKPKAAFMCQRIEKYPGDFRWRCGICDRGEVRPIEKEFCNNCGAYVCQLLRDEDDRGRRFREEAFKMRNAQYEREWERIQAEQTSLEVKASSWDRMWRRTEPEPKLIFKDASTSATIEAPPKKADLKVLPGVKPRRITVD